MRPSIVATLLVATAAAVPLETRENSVSIEESELGLTAKATPVQFEDFSAREVDAVDDDEEDVESEGSADNVVMAASPSGRAPVPTTYSQIAVFAHNLHRKNHTAPAIEWDKGLANIAEKIADSCIFEHNTSVGKSKYGQNIAAGVKPDNISAVVTNLWYNSEVNYFKGLYGEAQPSMMNFSHWGHFSQVVWKHSTKLGCATANCSESGLKGVGSNVPPFFTVCNYLQAGNYANEYGSNINAPVGLPSATWKTGLHIHAN